MALSTGLIRRLSCDNKNEPLAKRLKLAENVFCSPDLPIVRKEECIFQWLTSELSVENANTIWITIHRCLALEPKNFLRLSPQTKDVLIEKLIAVLNEYPESKVQEEMLKCCTYIFSTANANAYSKENHIVSLMEALLKFTYKKIINNDTDENSNDTNISLVLESTEKAVGSFTQLCRQNFSEKKNFVSIFIDKIFFPLATLVKCLKLRDLPSRLIVETQKCIKRLLLVGIRSVSSDEKDEKAEESNHLFNVLKEKVTDSSVEDTIATFECLFESAVSNYQQNSTLIDTILRKLINCVEHKEKSRQVLVSLLEKSADVSYNFDNEIEGVTLKSFLKNHIEEVVSKKKALKCTDYELLTAIAKLNPLIIEDSTQSILERIFLENRKNEKEELAYGKLVKELWKASVRLRRQHKFLSKFLITLNSFKDKETETLKLDLPENFIAEFGEDLKTKTTSAQLLGIFHTLNFHLKSDCVEKLQAQTSSLTEHSCFFIRAISKFFTTFFEYANFLDSTLPHDWQVKFYQAFKEFRNNLETVGAVLCENINTSKTIIFIAYTDLIKIWCEVNDLLEYYMSSITNAGLEFPISECQLKEMKKYIKKCDESEICEKLLDQIILLKSLIFKREDQDPVKDKIISNLWSEILQNHIEIVSTLNEPQLLKLAANLVDETTSTQGSLEKWGLFLKRNIPRISKAFATAIALEILKNIVADIESSTTKKIIGKINFEDILRSCNESNENDKLYKSVKKEISKQDFELVNKFDFQKVRNNLLLLLKLPLAFLDKQTRKFLFLILYTFEEETKTVTSLKEWTSIAYSDLLRHNDIDVLRTVSKPSILIHHFKDNHQILTKMFKLSLVSSPVLTFWDDLVNEETCDRKIKCILLTCIDQSKTKAPSSEHKTYLHDLSLKLSRSITKEFDGEVVDPDEIAGLRVGLKIILAEKKKLKSNLKLCVESTLKKALQDSEELIEQKSIVESLHLSLVVLSQRDNFNIDEDIVKKLCIILINNPDTKIFSHFLEVLKDNEFEFFARSLSSKTKQSLVDGDESNLQKLVTIWESLSKAEAKGIRSKALCASVNTLLNELLCSEIKGNSAEYLLRICRAFVTSKRMIRLTDKLVDSIFVVALQSLKTLATETKFTACQEALGLCLDFVRQRSEFILDRLPVLDNLFRLVFSTILREAKETNFADEQMLRILAIDIEKYCTFFAKLKKDVARISPYLIADLIDMTSSTGVLPSYLKISLESATCQLLSNCDRHAISFLSRTLPTSTQQVFKTIYDNYTKYYKFTGKI